VTVDRATGVDDMAGVDVIEGATDAAGTPILRLGGAADVETIVAAGCAAAIVGAAVIAEVPKLRLAVGAVPKAATVDVAGKENPPIAGADVVVAEGFKPKLNPPVGAVGAGAVAVAAGAPNPNPADAVVVVILPSPRLREGAADGAGAPNESGLAAGAARAVVAGTGGTVAAGAPPNEKDVAPPIGAAPPNGATPIVGNDPPNPNEGALAVFAAGVARRGAIEAEAGAMGLPNETPDEGAPTAAGAPKVVAGAPKAGAAAVAGAPKAGAAAVAGAPNAGAAAVAGAPNAGAAAVAGAPNAGAAAVAGAPKENPELAGAG